MYAWKASTLQLACWSVDSVYRIAWGRWGPPKAGERADRENGTVPRQSCTQDIVRFAPAEQPGTMSEIRGRIVGISKNNSPMLSLASIPVDYFAGGPQIWLVLSWCWTLLLHNRNLQSQLVRECLIWFRHTYVSWNCIRWHSWLIHDTNSMKWVQQTIMSGKRFIFQGEWSSWHSITVMNIHW